MQEVYNLFAVDIRALPKETEEQKAARVALGHMDCPARALSRSLTIITPSLRAGDKPAHEEGERLPRHLQSCEAVIGRGQDGGFGSRRGVNCELLSQMHA